uniref:Syntaxin-6 n=1 Tax=Naegleria fowleri TaxID=5763 RepID=A0A2P1N6T6_NAEFO|nr:syntaxin-6 [Naegleria fowleri]
MNSADPFDIVKDKVTEKLRSVKVLQEMYMEQINGSGTMDEVSITGIERELRNNIQSIDLFLNDLQGTINIVEKNPQRFSNISREEIGKRKLFISSTSQQMRQIEQQMKNRKQKQTQLQKESLFSDPKQKGSSSAQLNDEDDDGNYHDSFKNTTTTTSKGRYSRLEESYIKDNQRFIDEQLQIQDTVRKNQDEQMDKMTTTVQRVGQIAIEIGNELDEHKRELEEMENHVEKTKGLLERTNKRLQTLLNNTSDKWKIIIIVILLLIVLGLIAVVIFVPFR